MVSQFSSCTLFNRGKRGSRCLGFSFLKQHLRTLSAAIKRDQIVNGVFFDSHLRLLNFFSAAFVISALPHLSCLSQMHRTNMLTDLHAMIFGVGSIVNR